MFKRFGCLKFIGIIILIMLGLLCYATRPVDAQTATPTETPIPATLTPTPEVSELIEIGTEGEHFRLERSITYGEISVALAVMLLTLVAVVYVIWRLITHYLR